MDHKPPDSLGSYDDGFYAEQAPGSERSATAILPLAFRLSRPTSLVDVGCGVGTWLQVARELGVPTVFGVDGDYVRRTGLRVDEHEFQPADLRVPLPSLARRFDMALCVEVAEHLPVGRAQGLVDDLCALADVVVFSAAIPGQGGTDHINLQPQSAWSARFAVNGYQGFDLVRPYVWADPSVDPWYRQNILVFVNRDCLELAARATEMDAAAPGLLDVVHPDVLALWVRRATRPVSTMQALRLTARAVRRAAGRRLHATRSSRQASGAEIEGGS